MISVSLIACTLSQELAARADEWAGDMVVPKTVQKRIVELKAIEGGKS